MAVASSRMLRYSLPQPRLQHATVSSICYTWTLTPGYQGNNLPTHKLNQVPRSQPRLLTFEPQHSFLLAVTAGSLHFAFSPLGIDNRQRPSPSLRPGYFYLSCFLLYVRAQDTIQVELAQLGLEWSDSNCRHYCT